MWYIDRGTLELEKGTQKIINKESSNRRNSMAPVRTGKLSVLIEMEEQVTKRWHLGLFSDLPSMRLSANGDMSMHMLQC